MLRATAEDVSNAFEPFAGLMEVEYRPHAASDRLLVVVSHGPKIGLATIKYRANVLFIADVRQNYYITHALQLSNAIIELSQDASEVLFLGTSKGGFGALLLAGLCAAKVKTRNWKALAFTPIVDLTEPDGSLLPSAARVRSRAARLPSLMTRLNQYGKVAPHVRDVDNLIATVVYPLKGPEDTAAALSLAAPNIRLYPLSVALHSTLFAFLNQRRPVEDIKLRLQRILRTSDPDLLATMADRIDEVASDIKGMSWLPTVDELIEEAFRLGDKPPARVARPAA
jgi:hypothetical protein